MPWNAANKLIDTDVFLWWLGVFWVVYFSSHALHLQVLSSHGRHISLSFSIYKAYIQNTWVWRWKSGYKTSISHYSYTLWNIHDIGLEKKTLTWTINWHFQTSTFWLGTIIKVHLLVKFLRALTFAALEMSLIGPRLSFLAIFLVSLEIMVSKIIRWSSSIYPWHNLKKDQVKRLLESFYKSFWMTTHSDQDWDKLNGNESETQGWHFPFKQLCF